MGEPDSPGAGGLVGSVTTHEPEVLSVALPLLREIRAGLRVLILLELARANGRTPETNTPEAWTDRLNELMADQEKR